MVFGVVDLEIEPLVVPFSVYVILEDQIVCFDVFVMTAVSV